MARSGDRQSVSDAWLLEWQRKRSIGGAVLAGLVLCYAWLLVGVWAANLLTPDGLSALSPTSRLALALATSGPLLAFLAGVVSGRWVQRDHLTTAVVFASIANILLWGAYRFLVALGGWPCNEPRSDWGFGTLLLCGAIFCSIPPAAMLAHLGRKLVNTRRSRPDPKQSDEPADEVDALDETD